MDRRTFNNLLGLGGLKSLDPRLERALAPSSGTPSESDHAQIPFHPFDPVERAGRHAIVRDGPAVNFFEGAVLGNGHLGVIVTTRPDSLKVYFGHNSVLDIRAKSIPMDELGTFEELWGKFKKGDRGWLEAYNKKATEPSDTQEPRPWPCGSLLIGFDRRDAELIGHTLHIESGILEIRILVRGELRILQAFTEFSADRLWLRMVDARGKEISAPFLRMVLSSHEGMPSQQWKDEHTVTFRQVLTSLQSGPNKDRAVQVSFRSNWRIVDPPPKQPFEAAPANLEQDGPFLACVQLTHGLASEVPDGVGEVTPPTCESWERVATETHQTWRDYWNRSGVALDDTFLEETWYRNQYFLNCVARPGAACPTLFGNWALPGGSEWSGEYVLDYNAEQVFWGTFSSNRLENNLPYADMVDLILPVGRNWAKNFYELPGTFIAQRHWAVQTPTIPVPWFGWGNMMSATPWTMQGLWWHYRYSMDGEFLRTRAFGPIKEAAEFMNAFMRRPDAHGPSSPWKDDKFHIYPTQSPEIWRQHFGEPEFSDAPPDLTLTKFLFNAYLSACRELRIESQESELMNGVREILDHFPDYPTKDSPRGGKVYVDVAGASPDAIYNTPNTLMPVFPGEEIGLHSPPEVFEIAANTWRTQQNEGGNELVFLNLQGARLGLLDLGKFKRELRYCQMPDGTFTDMNLQAGGRVLDSAEYDFMRMMGIWVENFAIPAVINECVIQSYTGEIRLFPNWSMANGNALFQTLRAVGAFLVSAEYREGKVRWVRITSEAGQRLRLINPWRSGLVVNRNGSRQQMQGDHIELATDTGETLELREAS
jgi:hypothetical protein